MVFLSERALTARPERSIAITIELAGTFGA